MAFVIDIALWLRLSTTLDIASKERLGSLLASMAAAQLEEMIGQVYSGAGSCKISKLLADINQQTQLGRSCGAVLAVHAREIEGQEVYFPSGTV